MKFVLDIDCGNASFCDDEGQFDQQNSDAQVAEILEIVAKKLDGGLIRAKHFPHNGISVHDHNGNPVGFCRYEPVDDAERAVARKLGII